MKNKLILGAVSATFLMGVIGVIALNGKSILNASKADATYTMTFDPDHEIVDAQAYSDLGNKIWTKNGGVVWGTETLTFARGAYIQNTSKLNGITAVVIEMDSGELEVQHGFTEPKDLKTLMYYDGTATSSVTINVSGDPGYVRVIATKDSVVRSIKYKYSCATPAEQEIPVMDEANYGYEALSTANCNTSIVSIVNDGFISSKCVKIRTKDTNELTFSVNVKDAINAGTITVEPTVSCLTFDVKDDNHVMENNNRYGFQAQVEAANSQGSGWMDTVNWGVKELGNGWYRCYYTFTKTDVANLKNINLFPRRKNSENNYAANYYVDNIRLFESDTLTMGYKDSFGNIAPTNYDASKTPSKVYFEYQLDDSITTANISVGSGWSDYYGAFTIVDGVSNYAGLTTRKLGCGWYSFELDTTQVTQITGSPTNNLNLVFIKKDDVNKKMALSNFKIEYSTVAEVDRLMNESVSGKTYTDKLDHFPQVITEVSSGVTIEKETDDWKVTAVVEEECWDWVTFDLGENYTITKLKGVDLKFVNAQKWTAIRFFDENLYPLGEQAGYDFTSDDFNTAAEFVGNYSNVRYVGFCLHFNTGVTNEVYIKNLHLAVPENGLLYAPYGTTTRSSFLKLGVGEGNKIELTIYNITHVADDVGFRLKESASSDKWFGKFCVEDDYSLYVWGGHPGYTAGVSLEKLNDHSCKLTLDIDGMGTGKEGKDTPSYVSVIEFSSDIATDACYYTFKIIKG